jgi:hypothetical protein
MVAEIVLCLDLLLQTPQKDSKLPRHARLLQAKLINKYINKRLNMPIILGDYKMDEKWYWCLFPPLVNLHF